MAKPTNIELPGKIRIPIVFENRTLLIVDKPAGWVLGPDGPIGKRGNLQIAVESSIGAGAFWARSRSLKFLRFVHRLDADTTGLLMFSKSFGGLEPLSDLFAERKVEKRYLAVVEGVPDECHWTCTLPLGPDQEHNGRHRVDKENGRESETRFEVLASIPGRTLIACEPLTGRSHQIRIHLAEAGHPLLGERVYAEGEARRSKVGAAKVDAKRNMLHAWTLAFPHPLTGEPIAVDAPLPEDFEEVLKRLRRRAGSASDGAGQTGPVVNSSKRRPSRRT